MSLGFATRRAGSDINLRTKKARYAPRLSGTSETVVSSVIELSHTSRVLRAASIRSAAL